MFRTISRRILLLCCIVIAEGVPAQNSTDEYIEKYRGVACELSFEYCIPASVILGIAIVESGACNSRNCKLLNNHFGIKSGRKQRIPGTKHITAYKFYESDLESYRDFARYISARSFYPELICNPDYEAWVNRISRSGYARAATAWKKKVLLTIRKNQLYELDN